MSKTNDQTYDGPVCFHDGWHHTVVIDEDDRDRSIAVAQHHLEYARKRGTPDQVEIAEGEMERVQSHSYETHGERLVQLDDGTYRLAGDDDTASHNQVHGQRFAMIEMTDGSEPTRVTEEEFAAIQELLRMKRGGK